ncbi:hypothetical protein EIK77_010301 [Talaromyces pinophilus]|nr:hypothetical protein EIK77_010301 [Talaromyces pinophilus]
MTRARPQYANKLEFVQIQDFENPGGLTEAVKGVDAVIHVASVRHRHHQRSNECREGTLELTLLQPFNYDITDNEKELIIPAINGVRSMLEAACNAPNIQRVVITSSFAAVVDINRTGPQGFTYTAADWNPLTYEEAADPKSTPVVAYRGSKKYAELAAWEFIQEKKPHFDIVTLCPPMVFGPIAHPIKSLDHLNESNTALWEIAQGLSPLPTARVPFWIDVRDLATAHVEAALRKEAGGKRYTPASPERWSYGLAAQHMVSGFPELRDKVKLEEQIVDETLSLDGETAANELGYQCRKFEETIRDFTAQCLARKEKEST